LNTIFKVFWWRYNNLPNNSSNPRRK